MKIFFGGTRGTSCVSDKRFSDYGGDTTAVLVSGADGEQVIIDAGTGLRRIADWLNHEKVKGPLTLLMTHFHLDHIMGLPSFAPIYSSETELTLMAARHGRLGVRDIMGRLMKQPIWPVELKELRSRLHFRELDSRACSHGIPLGGMIVQACAVQHPGGCTAYRIEDKRRALVFATDIEWGLMSDKQRESFLRLCREPRPADGLVMDGQYEEAEYGAHQGWGHSTQEDVLRVAAQADIRRVFVTHHSPHCDDDELARRERLLKAHRTDAFFARDGLEVDL